MPASAYTLQDYYWEGGRSALQIDSSVNSSHHSAIYNAANNWSNVQGSSFYFYNNSSATTNKTIVRMGAVANPNWLGSEQPIVVSGNYKRVSEVIMDQSRTWGNNSYLIGVKTIDFETVVVHELGHSVGLGHSATSSAIMYNSSPLLFIKRGLTNDDINGIKARYPLSRPSSFKSGLNSFFNDEIIQIEINALVEAMTEEEMENRADLIVYGTVKEILPAQWDTPDGSDPSIQTKNMYSTEGYQLYYDTLIVVEDIYKGELESKEIYVRSSGGSTDKVKMICDSSAVYNENDKVILYLFEDNGTRSQNLGPEHYFAYPKQGQLFVKNDKTVINGHGDIVDLQNLLTIKNDKIL